MEGKIKKYLNASGEPPLGAEVGADFMSSGGLAATTSAVGGAVGVAAAIPVIGQAVAIVGAIISIGQAFNTVEKQKQFKLQIKNLQELEVSYQQELDIAMWEGNQTLQLLKEEIEYREAAAKTDKILLYTTFGILAISSMVFVYGINKLKR